MKCESCGKKIEETFLSKFKGTYVKVKENKKNKLITICNECQKKLGKDLKKNLPR